MPYDTAKAAGMHNTEGINVDLYIHKWWAHAYFKTCYTC